MSTPELEDEAREWFRKVIEGQEKRVEDLLAAIRRDYFAGQALAGLVGDYDYQNDHEGAAKDAYAYADAMIAEREKAK